MKNIAEYLKGKYVCWGWMGQRAHDALGINKVLPLDFIISCDYGTDIAYYFREEDVFSVEKYNKIRRDWSNEDLKTGFNNTLGSDIIARWKSYKDRINLLSYRSIDLLEKDINSLKLKPRIYAVPERMKRYFDNKTLLYQKLPQFLIPRIPGRITAPGKIGFDDLRKELSLPFVIQFPYGSSGHFTFIIREKSEYSEVQKKYSDSIVVIRKYIDGFSANVNAVIVSTEEGLKTICTFPSVQITGLPECSNFPSAFCGNDFTAAAVLEKSIIDEIRNQIGIIGNWMADEGYRGIFGMDFVIKEEKVYPVEINPRFQNSTSLFSALNAEMQSHDDMLFLVHIAEYLQNEDKIMKEYLESFPFDNLMNPLNGSQIILHNNIQRSIIAAEVIPGAYQLGKHGLTLIKEGASFDACRGSNDILITCGVPGRNTVIEPNAPICKIQFRKSVLNPVDKRSLSGEVKEIVSKVYSMFELKKLDEVYQ